MHDTVLFYENISSEGKKMKWDEMAKLIRDRTAPSEQPSVVDRLLEERPELAVPKDEHVDVMDLMSIRIPKKD